jgi:hypothetical protein
VEPHHSGSSPTPGAKSSFDSFDGRRDRRNSRTPSTSGADAPDKPGGAARAPMPRRLIADQLYFGLDALALHDGANRMIARIAAQAPQPGRIDFRTLGEDFRLDTAASWTLLRAFLMDGLVQPDGTGGYRPTARFREYALACVVAPLSRARAKTLVGRAQELATRINSGSIQNPYRIQALAVAGSYMSRCDPLAELSLWLVLQKRSEMQGRRWRPTLTKEAGLRQIAAAMKALSSFVVVHVVADKQKVPRPFSLVFEADDYAFDQPVHAWEKFREWGASISRRLVLR